MVSFSEWHMDIEGCLSLRRACGPSVCQWSRCSPLPLPLSLPLPPPRPLPLPLEQWLALHSMIGRRDPLSQRVRLVCSAVRRGGSLLLSLVLLILLFCLGVPHGLPRRRSMRTSIFSVPRAEHDTGGFRRISPLRP